MHFAPRAKEFIGVDISADSLRECARQVDAVCDTPFRPVVVSVAEPETAAPHRTESGLAEMTTYPIAAFWEFAAACGLQPEAIQLVPKNDLDERYAYFLLSKKDASGFYDHA